jgi:hypothetical protein
LGETRTPRAASSAHTGITVKLGVDGENLIGELGVGALTLTRPRSAPPVVALAGHAELVAHKGHRVLFFVSPVRDRRIFHGCSFANQAATEV